MFGLRNKEEWQEGEEALKALDKEIATSKNMTFDGRKERELFRTVKNECDGIRREVILNFLPPILKELYDRARRLYEEEDDDKQLIALIRSGQFPARDWFDLV
ncbi:hypothetical protein IT411_01160, partial [Candidatus Peregrinibacteria bacterium]|nr:hypothetical protein [Candidatus Peregrinibacteria bacterium]